MSAPYPPRFTVSAGTAVIGLCTPPSQSLAFSEALGRKAGREGGGWRKLGKDFLFVTVVLGIAGLMMSREDKGGYSGNGGIMLLSLPAYQRLRRILPSSNL